ncbi:spore coat polysaccharide biosynthesis protein F, CMP-KDO synthetase [Acetivibrio clariflavus DSM 19732]|uniref:Spore coat polysaccharide biosynthesis protein F, CMP-KDO synthetase n=2 Tax=Acetivibrio clariflavus TaxID=288965 RepID=G8LTL0_ACECE|nr:spore coat polysaccharide biosynthesis protein F, CMP-KDO synthetase [Acetivibrio clariflavus DSM 19732]
MGSSRLPGKVMIDICGKPVIEHVIDRLKMSKVLDDIIIATTTSVKDKIIVEQAKRNGVKWFCGSEEDVLSRYYYAARENRLSTVVRVTSDCPLIDPVILDEIVEFYKKNDYLLVTNAGNILEYRTYPRGLDVEVFSFDILEKAFYSAKKPYQREHVTPYIYETYENKIYYYKNNINLSKYRWTLDTEEDLKLISIIFNNFYYKYGRNFGFKDILKFIQSNPQLSKINEHIEQKKIG